MAVGLPLYLRFTPSQQALTSGGFIDGQCCCSTEDGRTLVPAFLAMASSIQNKAVSQTELSSMALSLLRHSKNLLQPTQVFVKSPCQLLERTQVVQHPFQKKGSPGVQNQHVIPLGE